jgi:hypothetical protein
VPPGALQVQLHPPPLSDAGDWQAEKFESASLSVTAALATPPHSPVFPRAGAIGCL